MAERRRAKGDGTITRRKDGRWEGRYTVQTAAGPKRRAVYGKTRQETAEKLRRALAERDAGILADAGSLTVGDYLHRWLHDSVSETVKLQTWESYAGVIRRHISPGLGRIKVKALSPAHVQGFYRERLDAGLSPRSVQYMHAILHRALGQAVRWGLVPRNVCDAVDAPRPARRDIRPLTATQARRLLSEASEDRLHALYALAVTAGLRQGELLGLGWEDVDLQAGMLRVRRTLIAWNCKPRFDTPKTKGSVRGVALTSKAVDALQRHRGRQTEAGLYGPDALVFCTRNGTPITPTNLTRQSFRPLLIRAGLPRIRFHDLRHTCATLLLSRNVHPKIVSDMLGHASIQLTLDTYSHVLPGFQGPATDAMSDALDD